MKRIKGNVTILINKTAKVNVLEDDIDVNTARERVEMLVRNSFSGQTLDDIRVNSVTINNKTYYRNKDFIDSEN